MKTDEWIKTAQQIHGDRFDYSLVHYVNAHTKVTIVCKVHGPFDSLPCNHVNKWKMSRGSTATGCKLCQRVESGKARAHTTETFIEKAMSVHGARFDYSLVQYVNVHSSVNIICKKHGVFSQRASKHLSGCGCVKCINCHHSNVATSWLKHIESQGIKIQHKENGGEFIIPGTRLKVDGYCADTNTVYEFYGDYWHGNPKTQPANKKGRRGLTMTELFDRTMERECKIRSLGYNVVSVWESDWVNSRQ